MNVIFQAQVPKAHGQDVSARGILEPIVSVCIPTYNRAAMLKNAMDSVLAQTFGDFELIVSDNASSDGTEALVRSYRDERIRYVKHERNMGAVSNFNRCMAMCRGRYITVVNDDDVMLAENLLLKVQALNEHPNVGFVYSGYELVDASLRPVPCHPNFIQAATRDAVERGHDFLEHSLLFGCHVAMSSVVIRRDCIERIGGFNESLDYASDYDYWMRLSFLYDVMVLAVPLVQYRIHPTNDTGKFTTMLNGRLVPNQIGLEEVFRTKLAMITHAQAVLPAHTRILEAVREKSTGQLAHLIERQLLAYQLNREARAYLLRMWKRYPALLEFRTIVKLLLKTYAAKHLFFLFERVKYSQ